MCMLHCKDNYGSIFTAIESRTPVNGLQDDISKRDLLHHTVTSSDQHLTVTAVNVTVTSLQSAQ